MNSLILILFTVILGYFIIAFFLPKKTTIAAKLNMSGDQKTVFNTICNFTNWREWELWNENKLFKTILSKERNTVGARYRLKSTTKEIKDALIVLKEKRDFTYIQYHWYYGKRKRGTITFNISESKEATLVSVNLVIDNSRKPFGRYFSQWNKKNIQSLMHDVLLKIDATGI